jgi:two-component system response regulator AtoC
VRELRNVIERAFIVAGADTLIDTRHLSLQTPNPAVNAGVGKPLEPSNEESAFLVQGEPTLDEIERSYIHQLLVKYHGNRRRVADALGVSERTAYRMLERHGFK